MCSHKVILHPALVSLEPCAPGSCETKVGAGGFCCPWSWGVRAAVLPGLLTVQRTEWLSLWPGAMSVLCSAGQGLGLVSLGGGRPADALWVPQEGCSAGEMVSKKQHFPRVAGKAASGVSTLTTDSWVRGPVRGQLHAHRPILEDTAQRTGPGPAPAPSLWGTGKWALRPAPYSRPRQPPSMCH